MFLENSVALGCISVALGSLCLRYSRDWKTASRLTKSCGCSMALNRDQVVTVLEFAAQSLEAPTAAR